MNYDKHYDALIQKRRENPLSKDDCYCECHHIIPKSEGGSDDTNNLVNLTAREHYIAHLLLARIYNDNKMWCALNRMVHGNDFNRYNHISSRSYAFLKQNLAIQLSKMFKGKKRPNCSRPNNKSHLGHKHSEEAKAKMRAYATGRRHSEDSRRKISEANKGRKMSDQQRQKLISSFTEERRKQMSEKMKGIKPLKAIEKSIQKRLKPVYQYTVDGKFIKTFSSAIEASKVLGCSSHAINMCCRGVRKTCLGFVFKYNGGDVNG